MTLAEQLIAARDTERRREVMHELVTLRAALLAIAGRLESLYRDLDKPRLAPDRRKRR